MKMDDELIATFNRLVEQKDEIKKLGNGQFIVQHGQAMTTMSEESFRKLASSIKYDASYLIKQFQSLCKNEYMLIAYHDDNIIGTKITYP